MEKKFLKDFFVIFQTVEVKTHFGRPVNLRTETNPTKVGDSLYLISVRKIRDDLTLIV